MNIALIILTALLVPVIVWVVLRLFADRTYRPGSENDWAQRNDIRRESRGPDDYIGNPTGGDATEGVAE